MEDNDPVEASTPPSEPELPLPVEAPATVPAPEPEAASPETTEAAAPAPVSEPQTTPEPEPEAAAPAEENTPEAERSEPEAEAPGEETAEAEAPAAEAPAPNPSELEALAAKSAAQRLPAAEEEKAAELVRAGLLAGKEELAAVAAVLPRLGWAVAVKGVTNAWPELKATARTAFLKALIADESEAGRRIRLSLARGLFKVPDAAAGLKLALSVCKEIRDKKTGEIPQREAQNFANVMIGKGKPWIALVPLAELKPADAALLVHCALVASFSVNGPPVTPVGVLRWAAEGGQLADLHEGALALVVKGVARWSPKWADIFRREVPSAPEAILAALKLPEPAPAPAAPVEAEEPSESPEASSDREDEDDDENEEDRDEKTEGDADRDEDEDDEDEEDDDGLPAELKEGGEGARKGDRPDRRDRKKERPVYVSKTVPAREGRSQQQNNNLPQTVAPQREKGPAPKSTQYNATEALRQVESHINWLKNELQFTEKKLRNREDEVRQAKQRKPDVPVIEGEPTPEELARYNVQLEARIAELQARITDLTIDAETRATSAGAFTDEQPAADVQLRTLLGLKLAEAFADFEALEKEDRALVVPQHYRTVLAEVFAVLGNEGIPLAPPPVK